MTCVEKLKQISSPFTCRKTRYSVTKGGNRSSRKPVKSNSLGTGDWRDNNRQKLKKSA